MSRLAIRQLSIGEIIDFSFTIYRGHFATLFLIALFTSGIPLILNTYVNSRGGPLAAVLWYVLYLVLALSLGALASASTTFVVSEAYLGRSVTAGEALSRALPLLGQVVVLSFVMGFLVGLGTLFLLVPGIIIGCGLAVSTPALVLESGDAMEALRRSWSLTRGSRFKIFLLFLVVVIIIMIPVVGVTMVMGLLPGAAGVAGRPSATLILATVAGGLVEMLVYPIFYCALTLAYYDLRVRKEGFDLELLESNLQSA